jgi:hypothetical protein
MVVAVDDSPHSHSAWLWVVENVLHDPDEIILLHGVTTNVRSHRQCTDASPQQAALFCHGVERRGTYRETLLQILSGWYL